MEDLTVEELVSIDLSRPKTVGRPFFTKFHNLIDEGADRSESV